MRPNVRAAVAAALVGMVLAGLGAACAPKPAGEHAAAADSQAAASAGTVVGSAGPLHVDDGGSGGVPVLFVHGFSGSHAHWDSALVHLRATRRALALDLRGHGTSASPVDTAAWAVDSLASDIAAVVDQLGLERVVLVGHSLGGAASATYAGEHPDRVAGLVLVATPGPGPPGMAGQIRQQLEASYDSTMQGFWGRLLRGATPGTEMRIRSEASHLPKDASLAIIGAVFRADPLPVLRAYPGPILVVDTETRDRPAPPSIQTLIPRAQRRVIAGTSHWPQLDKPAELNAILDEFLATVGASGGPSATAPADTL
jgi:pimeloyl-ACP methyl ester carboxylesterase